MSQGRWSGHRTVGTAAAVLVISTAVAVAQGGQNSVSDAQVESNVLKTLAGTPQLADQKISSTTVYGAVTLSGTVRDEPTRTLAETVVSRTSGVQKVIDELTLPGEVAQQQPAGGGANDGSNPQLMSDGSVAPQNAAPPDGNNAQPGYPQGSPGYGQPQSPGYPAPDSQNGVAPISRQPATQPYGAQQGDPQQQPYPQQQPAYGNQQPYPGQPPYNNQPPYNGQQPYAAQQPYGTPQSGYPGQPAYASRPPYGAQVGGQSVTVAPGAMLRIRINQGLDSKHTQPGTTFDATVLNDVVADGFVAIPRGADVQGVVTDAEKAGVLRGRGELILKLTQVTLAGRSYPLGTDTWSNLGPDKTGRTVGNAIGLGALGALVGAAAGGGAGAAVGAGVGGAAGVGTSAASGGGQAVVPPEAILTFHLTQPASLQTVSQAEMDRLGSGVQPGTLVRRRPVPAYYGPGYYPYRY